MQSLAAEEQNFEQVFYLDEPNADADTPPQYDDGDTQGDEQPVATDGADESEPNSDPVEAGEASANEAAEDIAGIDRQDPAFPNDGVEPEPDDVAEPAEAPALQPQATASDLLDNALWIKQASSGWCTLDSAVMMLRRTALLNGRTDWQSITEASVKPVAWTNHGLRWSFTYQGMSVTCESLNSSNEAALIKLLVRHPEGVVIYNHLHAVLLTDYTDGVLYCADPAYGDRRPLKSAARNVRADNIYQYWYVTSKVSEVEPEQADVQDALLKYRTHVQRDGWQGWRYDGVAAGTSGRSLRLEGVELALCNAPYEGGIRYCTHVQTYGWQDWVANGMMSGTSGQSKRLEAIQIELTGQMARAYDVYYRVHAQRFGWMGWAKNGEQAGTAGYSYRLEAIQVVLVKKGAPAPKSTYKGVSQTVSTAFSQTLVQYRTHVQSDGWQSYVFDGAASGTSGRTLRLEGINIRLVNQPFDGSIRYRTHVQTYGWEDGWRLDGAMSGTSGQSKRLEAIQIELTGQMARAYDVYYRVHAQRFGWMGWAKNGEQAGTAGYSYRLEAIQIVLVEKSGAAPGATFEGVTQAVEEAFRER